MWTPEFKMSASMNAIWSRHLEVLDAMQAASRAEGDLLLFHGTSHSNARAICEGGFRPLGIASPYAGASGVYWGILGTATTFAMLAANRSGFPPVIFAAQLSALARSGDLLPDISMLETGNPRTDFIKAWPTWEYSLEHAGAIVVRDGCRVDPMHLVSPLATEALTPTEFLADVPMPRAQGLDELFAHHKAEALQERQEGFSPGF